MRELTYLQALREGQLEEMRRDERVFMMGEDLTCDVFGTTTGFLEEFGPERLRDTPISEAGFVGAAAGASMVGMRPIANVAVASFLYPAMDQLFSIIAKSRYLYGGQASLPLVLRMCLFYGNANAAQHSDRPHPMVMNMPGLKVIMPANPADMKGLIKSAIRDDDPVLCFEDATLWGSRGPVPEDDDFLVPIGKSAVVREGEDVTVVAIGGCVPLAIAAAERLSGENISVEVIDPRSLVPLDHATIHESLAKTGRAVIADPAHLTCSAASEISATIAQDAFWTLRAPVARVTTPDVHIPFSPVMEKPLFPTTDRIVAAVRSCFE